MKGVLSPKVLGQTLCKHYSSSEYNGSVNNSQNTIKDPWYAVQFEHDGTYPDSQVETPPSRKNPGYMSPRGKKLINLP